MNVALTIAGLAVICAAAAALAVPGLRRRRRELVEGGRSADDATLAVDRYLRAARLLALPAAIVVATLAVTALDGAGWLAAASFGALAVVLVIVVAESSAPQPDTSDVRTADLNPRDPYGYPGRARLVLARAALTLAAAACVAGALLAADDGRSVALSCAAGGASASPFPGAALTGPGAVGLVALLVTSEIALRRIARRPRSSPVAAADDDALRAASALTVTRVVTAAGLAMAAAVAGLAGQRLLGLDGPCPLGWRIPVGVALVVVAAGALLGTLGVLIDGFVARPARLRNTAA